MDGVRNLIRLFGAGNKKCLAARRRSWWTIALLLEDRRRKGDFSFYQKIYEFISRAVRVQS